MAHKFVIVILSSLIVITSLPGSADDNCATPNWEPYKKNVKLVCWIKRSNSYSMDGVLLTPIDSKSWIAWVYQTVYFAEPIDMTVVYNDCNGIGLQGEFGGDIYNLNVEENSARLIGTITRKESLENININGECQILGESVYEIYIKKKKDGKPVIILEK